MSAGDQLLSTLIAEPWSDYGLIDSGGGRKLERYGKYRFIRPEPQALWKPAQEIWDADGTFIPGSDEEGGGRWHFERPVPQDGWELGWQDVRFRASCTPFRHLAFFPDMAPQWAWMQARLGRDSEALNLFGYTGVGTLAMAATGASMVHVDASKKSVEAGKANAALSGMADHPIRWLVDDATKFAAREVRSAGWSTMPPNSPRARSGAAAATTGSSSTRPSSGAGRMARSGGWRRTFPGWSPTAAPCSTLTAASWC